MLLIDSGKIFLAGEEREDGGQNHCTPTTSFTFWKGNIKLKEVNRIEAQEIKPPPSKKNNL